MFLLTHKDLRRLPRVSAVFEFCLRELKPVLMRGERILVIGEGKKPASVDPRRAFETIERIVAAE